MLHNALATGASHYLFQFRFRQIDHIAERQRNTVSSLLLVPDVLQVQHKAPELLGQALIFRSPCMMYDANA